MTPSLVMDVETCTENCRDYLFGFENRKLGRHPGVAYGMVTATLSVVISATSPGMGSPVFRALSR